MVSVWYSARTLCLMTPILPSSLRRRLRVSRFSVAWRHTTTLALSTFSPTFPSAAAIWSLTTPIAISSSFHVDRFFPLKDTIWSPFFRPALSAGPPGIMLSRIEGLAGSRKSGVSLSISTRSSLSGRSTEISFPSRSTLTLAALVSSV